MATVDTTADFPSTLRISRPVRELSTRLWLAQGALALAYFTLGLAELSQPIARLERLLPWVDEYDRSLVRTIGAFELLGAAALVLPGLLGVLPRATPLAATFFAVSSASGAVFHLSRGEWLAAPLDALLLALSVYVAWGRFRRAAFTPNRPTRTSATNMPGMP